MPCHVLSNVRNTICTDDMTRVILAGGSGGDYINANYVNMEIPGSGIINRYIATQGKNTSIYKMFETTLLFYYKLKQKIMFV